MQIRHLGIITWLVLLPLNLLLLLPVPVRFVPSGRAFQFKRIQEPCLRSLRCRVVLDRIEFQSFPFLNFGPGILLTRDSVHYASVT